MSHVLAHRGYVLAELCSSEREYVERLRVLTEDYLQYIQLEQTVPAELKADILAIFNNLPEIYAFHHQTFLPALGACREDDIAAITQCFLTHKSQFGLYMPYCKNKPTSDAARTEHEAFFRQRQTALGHKLSIEDLLITPVQRFTKYQLLLQDLLKDTRKLKEDTSSIEAAVELMRHIPRETNNIICMSLIRGVHRSRLVGHGTLWLQDTLVFWSDKSHGGVKAEPRHVFLFDHRIFVALPANSDGFFDYQLDIKTLKGSLQEEVKGDSLRFSFTTAEKSCFVFQASSVAAKSEWLSGITSILASQNQMMRDLVSGTKHPQPRPSEGDEWESDSSVDSSSPQSSTGDPDWPASPGYEKLRRMRSPTMPNTFVNTLTLPGSLSHSTSFTTSRDFMKPRSKSWAASLSPKLIARFKRRPTIVRQQSSVINMPIAPSQKKGGLRSPGSAPRAFGSLISPEGLLVVKEEVKGENGETVSAGQLAVCTDVSEGAEWSVKLLSGLNSGLDMSLPREYLQPYTAPVSHQLIAETYSLSRELGRGRFGKVVKAKHKVTGAHHALKLVRPQVREEAFEHELCTLFHLDHPNVARCYGGVVSSRERALTFELVKGRNLLDHLVHKARITDADVAELLQQLLAALAYLHARSVCHLDCRPANVLVQETRHAETVKLIDFGAARHFNCDHQQLPLEHSYESPASYHYLAPEGFQQQPLAPAADIWTVGVVTFIIFHGQYPFAGDTEAATIAKVMRGNLVLPNDGTCSQSVRSFIKSTLLSDPCMRPSAAAATDCKWFKEDHSIPGAGPWQVNTALIKHFLSSSAV